MDDDDENEAKGSSYLISFNPLFFLARSSNYVIVIDYRKGAFAFHSLALTV